jgi:hypothetical protein
MPVTRSRRGRTAAVAGLVSALAVSWASASPATARDCGALGASATTTGGRTQVLLSLPSAMTGAPLRTPDISLQQDGLDLPVLSVAVVPAGAADVVVVVDSSAAAGPAADRVRAATTALLQGLPAQTRVAVLGTGGSPAVVQDLVRGPRAAVPAVARLEPAGPNALVDTLLAGLRLLPADPGRQQQLVLVGAGADSGSAASWPAARQLLVHRGVAFDVVDLGSSASLPGAGAQCPGLVDGGDAAAAGLTLAKHLADRRLVVVPTVTGTSPVQVSVSHAGTTVSTTLATRADAPGPAREPRSASGEGAAGLGTLVLALLVGLLGLLVLLLVTAGRSARGAAVRAALRASRAAGQPGLPAAEAVRRRADARVDLQAALGTGPTARELAEVAAYAEAAVRAQEEAQHRAAEERAAAYARAAERRERARRGAEVRAETDRAAREATTRLDRLRPLPTTGLAGADPDAMSVLAEAEHAVTAQRLAAQEAMTRRAEAERLADEAEARAERERVAAVAAQQSREAAETAAAEALARAEEEVRTAGAASKARNAAEKQAKAAAAEAAEERRAAEDAVARRMVAEAQAAEAEAAQDAAVHRELAALEAAEAAEAARREAVARLAEDGEAAAAAAETAPAVVDLRPPVASVVSPAAEVAARRTVVVPVGPSRSTRPGTGGGPAVPPDSTPEMRAVAPEVAEEPSGGEPADDDQAAAEDPVPEAVGVVAVDEKAAQPVERPRPAAWVARGLALLVVPVALVLRTGLAPRSGLGGTAVLLAVAAVLTALGVRWVWVATSPPYALLRRTARRIAAATELQRSQADDAAHLLAAVREGTTDDAAWVDFERRSGLVVPGGTRAALDPGMDPAALVRYLTARQRDGLPTPQSLLVVTVVPVLVCLLPAALLVLVS